MEANIDMTRQARLLLYFNNDNAPPSDIQQPVDNVSPAMSDNLSPDLVDTEPVVEVAKVSHKTRQQRLAEEPCCPVCLEELTEDTLCNPVKCHNICVDCLPMCKKCPLCRKSWPSIRKCVRRRCENITVRKCSGNEIQKCNKYVCSKCDKCKICKDLTLFMKYMRDIENRNNAN